jgi:hypothetical protein
VQGVGVADIDKVGVRVGELESVAESVVVGELDAQVVTEGVKEGKFEAEDEGLYNPVRDPTDETDADVDAEAKRLIVTELVSDPPKNVKDAEGLGVSEGLMDRVRETDPQTVVVPLGVRE